MNKRQSQKAATRKKIRETAKQLFGSQGFEQTTSRQIAKEAGVAAGTIFVHFESKHAILLDILYEDIEASVVSAFQTLPQLGTTQEKLLHLARVLYAYYAENVGLSRVLLQQSLIGYSAESTFHTQIDQFIIQLTQLIQHGQNSGDVNRAKDAHSMAQTYMAAYLFVLMQLLSWESAEIDRGLNLLAQMTETILT